MHHTCWHLPGADRPRPHPCRLCSLETKAVGQGRGHPDQGTPKKAKAASERCSHRTYAPGWGLQWGSSPLGLEEEEPPSPGAPGLWSHRPWSGACLRVGAAPATCSEVELTAPDKQGDGCHKKGVKNSSGVRAE